MGTFGEQLKIQRVQFLHHAVHTEAFLHKGASSRSQSAPQIGLAMELTQTLHQGTQIPGRNQKPGFPFEADFPCPIAIVGNDGLTGGQGLGQGAGQVIAVGDLTLHRPWGEILMLLAAVLSLLLSPKHLHKENRFAWGPIVEVAVLFIGIFVTMAPALAYLKEHGGKLGITEAWQYFWLTGGLSALLDNAPTYVTFCTLAGGGDDFGVLADGKPLILTAISCGAVFMGACSYIGNGPNFMVKAIAEEAGYKMPSFFGYILRFSLPVLMPVFVVITVLFFAGG